MKGYTVMDFINHTLQNFNQVYSQQTEKRPNRFAVYCKGDEAKGFIPVDLEIEQGEGNYYNIVSAMPHRDNIKGLVLFDGSATPSADTTNGTLIQDGNNNGGVASQSAFRKSTSPIKNSISQNTEGRKNESIPKKKKDDELGEYSTTLKDILRKNPELADSLSDAQYQQVLVHMKNNNGTVKDGVYTFPTNRDKKNFSATVFAILHEINRNGKASLRGDAAKLHKMIMEAAPVLNAALTKQQKNIAALGDRMGTPVVWLDGAKELNGFHADGITFLNRKAGMSLPKVFWHESFHYMRAHNPALYDAIAAHVQEAERITPAQINGYRRKLGRYDLADEDIIEEMLADKMQDASQRAGLFKAMAIENRSLAARAAAWIRRMIDRFVEHFRGAGDKLSERQTAAMARAFSAVMRDMKGADGLPLFRVRGEYVENMDGSELPHLSADANKKQATDFYQSAGLQLPMEGRKFNDLFRSSIPTEEDLVNAQEEREKPSDLKGVSDEHPSEGAEPNVTALGFGAPRNIRSTFNSNITQKAGDAKTGESTKGETADEKLAADSKAWERTLAEAWKGNMPGSQMLKVMETPLALQLVGAKDLPMYIKQSKLMDIRGKHHEMTKKTFQKLPKYLADPMIIFKSRTKPGRIVAGLDLVAKYIDKKTKKEIRLNVIVPVSLDAHKGHTEINVIASAYGKETNDHEINYTWFWDNIQEGNTLYINKNKAAAFYQSAGLQLPMEGRRFSNLFGSSIQTEEDLVKMREEHPGKYSAQGESPVKFSAALSDVGAPRRFFDSLARRFGRRAGLKADKIIVEERARNAKQDMGLSSYMLRSPSRVIKKYPIFLSFFRAGERAYDVLTERRSHFDRRMKEAFAPIKNKKDYADLREVLLAEDSAQKVYTRQELLDNGVKENVIEAHDGVRAMMAEAYEMVNEAHKRPTVKTANGLSDIRLDALKQNKFVRILRDAQDADGKYSVTYREYANYERTMTGVSEAALRRMEKDTAIQILKTTQAPDGSYTVKLREGKADLQMHYRIYSIQKSPTVRRLLYAIG